MTAQTPTPESTFRALVNESAGIAPAADEPEPKEPKTMTHLETREAGSGGGVSVGHTPGPWRVVVYDAGDKPHWSGVPSIQAPAELDCAIVHWDGFAQEYWRSARGDAEIQANARLIAAAPELLAALKRLIPTNVATDNANVRDDQVLPCDVTMGELRQAVAAISKATTPAIGASCVTEGEK